MFQSRSQDAKICGSKFEGETRHFHSPKNTAEVFINHKGNNFSLQWRNPADTMPQQVTKVNIINNRTYWCHGPHLDALKRAHHCCGILVKIHNLNPTLSHQIDPNSTLRRAKILKDKGRLKNSHRWEETKTTCQPSCKWDLESYSPKEKGH